MSRGFVLLLLGATAAGTACGIVMKIVTELSHAEATRPPPLPPFPGQLVQPPPPSLGWARPAPGTPERALLDDMLSRPAAYGRDRLLEHLVHLHPAVRAEVLNHLGQRMAGTRDPETVGALRSRLDNEQDPLVRSAAKTAWRSVTGEEPPPAALP